MDFLNQYNFGIIIQEKSNFVGCLLSRRCNELHTIESLCVAKEHRGNNLGREMLDLLEEHLIGDLSLHVDRKKNDHKLPISYEGLVKLVEESPTVIRALSLQLHHRLTERIY